MALQEPQVIEESDSYKGGEVDQEKSKNLDIITYTYDASKFVIVPANHEIGRDIDAAWFGVKVLAPTNVDNDKINSATYDNGEGTTKKYFAKNEDTATTDKTTASKRFINVYGAITKDILTNAVKSGNPVSYTWRFDWDNDGKIDQIVNVKVQPKNLVLEDEKDETLWNGTIAEMVETQVKNETPAEETTATEESGKDSQPKTGEGIPMALVGMMTLGLAGAYTFKKSNVFVVGNVSASTTVLEEKDVTFGKVEDVTKTEGDVTTTGKYTSTIVTDTKAEENLKNKNVTINVSAASLDFIDANRNGIDREFDAAWIGIEVPKLTASGHSSATITATYSFNNGEVKEIADEDYEDGKLYFWSGVTIERLQEAMKNDGKLTFTYKIVWTVSEEADGNKTEGTFEQTITINVDAAKVTLTDARVSAANKDVVAKTLWAPSIAKAYKDSLPATTPAEDPSNPGEPDPQPKTGEEIPMALVGMMTLGLAGAYTFKKSYIRRRQRLC